VKHSPDYHADYTKLKAALKKFEEIAAAMNESKRVAEFQQKLVDLQQNLKPADSSMEVPVILDPNRKLIRDELIGLVQKGRLHKRRVLLFSDILLIVKPESKKQLLEAALQLDSVKVVNIADTEVAKHMFGLEIPNGDEAYQFSCDDVNQKSEWVKKLKEIVREYQKEKVEALKQGGGGGAKKPAGSPLPVRRPT